MDTHASADVYAHAESITHTIEHANPLNVAYPYRVAGGDFDTDLVADVYADPYEYRVRSFGNPDNKFTVFYGNNGRIDAVVHKHADIDFYNCLPDFTNRPATFQSPRGVRFRIDINSTD